MSAPKKIFAYFFMLTRKCYYHDENNDELVKILMDRVQLEKIKNYDGPLNQEAYDELLERE